MTENYGSVAVWQDAANVWCAKAPGKLFIVGEYAVVEAGEPAVIVAVDRFLQIKLRAHDAVQQAQCRITSAAFAAPISWRRSPIAEEQAIVFSSTEHQLVCELITICERLRAEMNIPAKEYDLHISSELDDELSGTKFGLGSSGALAAALVTLLDNFYGFNLSLRQRYQLALLATLKVSAKASGGDIAASIFGGWVLYRSPNRQALGADSKNLSVQQLFKHSGWRSSSVEILPRPQNALLLVAWTGKAASTDKQVEKAVVNTANDFNYRGFINSSRANVLAFAHALKNGGSFVQLATKITQGRKFLKDFAQGTKTNIETQALKTLCDIAQTYGGAAKTSGAGGGDCGIALCPDTRSASLIHQEWRKEQLKPLELQVVDSKGQGFEF